MSFLQSKTSNGINVVTYSMEHVNSVTINVLVKVGSRYESEQESGISHFLEHMAFKGTSNRTATEIAIEFDTIGGHFNAYTSRENTVYYTKVLSQHTKQAMTILADILQNSVFSSDEITKEFNVISQEIAEVKDNPDDLVYEKFYKLAYPNQPLGRSILGTVENIAKFDKPAFTSYMSKHYTANNIVISIAGKINHDAAVHLVEQLFSSFSESEKRSCMTAQYKGGIEIIEKDLEQTTIALGFEGVSYSNIETFYHAQILSIIFGGGLSSRLFQKIREELGLAYSIGSWLNSYSDSGIFSIHAATDHSNVESVLDNINNEIDKIRISISEEELIRAKSQIESNIYMAEERPEYKSEEIGKNFSIFGKYFTVKEVMKIINSTQNNDLVKSAEKIFSSQPTLSIIGSPSSDLSTNFIARSLSK
ncbi:M16 family peptidase [Candidatus Megaera venefica]|uniref:M16 family peptidase n=1 Tax=Candidatus Megaera venefica TaxID=2055910 RepID=A0ABU5NA87_9RICK|nr:pitrilysin family protein [Candidatus Megaera venefica]MEA0970081.1 M16 family peptidase [Candidatus Megaera venefica]